MVEDIQKKEGKTYSIIIKICTPPTRQQQNNKLNTTMNKTTTRQQQIEYDNE